MLDFYKLSDTKSRQLDEFKCLASKQFKDYPRRDVDMSGAARISGQQCPVLSTVLSLDYHLRVVIVVYCPNLP